MLILRRTTYRTNGIIDYEQITERTGTIITQLVMMECQWSLARKHIKNGNNLSRYLPKSEGQSALKQQQVALPQGLGRLVLEDWANHIYGWPLQQWSNLLWRTSPLNRAISATWQKFRYWNFSQMKYLKATTWWKWLNCTNLEQYSIRSSQSNILYKSHLLIITFEHHWANNMRKEPKWNNCVPECSEWNWRLVNIF